jgi:phospholipase A1
LAAYNTTPNRDAMLDVDPRAKAQNTEVKFQLSGKIRPLPDCLLGKNFDFWVGYTQLSFWQMYNSAFSAPFRDTNYQPEGFFTYRTNYDLFGLHLLNARIINAGFVHQSNGRSVPLSRSWNRLFAEVGFEKVFDKERKEGRNEFNLFVKSWYRLPENSLDDDNPDIAKYMGYGEILGVYYWQKCRFGLMLRNNLQANDNKGALQLDVNLPFPKFITSDRISFYIQYFNGYGESLLDYNSSSNRISAGIMITNWGQ